MPSIKAEQLTDCAIRKARWPIGNLMTVVIIAAFLAMDRSRVCLWPAMLTARHISVKASARAGL